MVTGSMRKLVSAGHQLRIVYEAGPCGLVRQRATSPRSAGTVTLWPCCCATA